MLIVYSRYLRLLANAIMEKSYRFLTRLPSSGRNANPRHMNRCEILRSLATLFGAVSISGSSAPDASAIPSPAAAQPALTLSDFVGEWRTHVAVNLKGSTTRAAGNARPTFPKKKHSFAQIWEKWKMRQQLNFLFSGAGFVHCFPSRVRSPTRFAPSKMKKSGCASAAS